MTVHVHSQSTLAKRWGCSRSHIRNMITAGEIPFFRVGGKLVRIKESDVLAFENKEQASIMASGEDKAPETYQMVGKRGRNAFKPHYIPPNTMPVVRSLFEVINDKNETLKGLEDKAGVRGIYAWRNRSCSIANFEAVANCLGYELVLQKRV